MLGRKDRQVHREQRNINAASDTRGLPQTEQEKRRARSSRRRSVVSGARGTRRQSAKRGTGAGMDRSLHLTVQLAPL